MKAQDWYWFRQLSGGYWVNRRGMGWKRATKRHYDDCRTCPSIWQVIAVEDHSQNDGLFGVVIMACVVSAALLLSVAAGWV